MFSAEPSNGLLGTVDIGVHVVHTSHVIITYTLESLSYLTYITHNIQATINFKKKYIKNKTQTRATVNAKLPSAA